MKFTRLANYLSKLDQTTKRLEITDILADLIKNLDQKEIRIATNLILGQLKAPFENQKFNIADEMMLKILKFAYSTPQKIITSEQAEALYNKIGDLGDMAFELSDKQKTSTLTITQVYEKLFSLAEAAGTGSQDIKIRKASELLKELDSNSARYVVRIILGTTRLGFTELTFIAALALFLGDKGLAPSIETCYSVHPDIGLIAEKIKTKSMVGIKELTIETGVPILSQKAQRLGSAEEAIEKMGIVWTEFKFDGTRVQLHIDRQKPTLSKENTQVELFAGANKGFLTKTYTRNLDDTTHQYPDLVAAAQKQIDAKSAILDGEAIGFNPKTGEFLPFQETMQRKRKYDVADTAKSVPLKYFVFDLLYLNGKSLVDLPLRERKRKLIEIVKPGGVISVDDYFETSNPDELYDYYQIAKDKGLEGVIVKKPGDAYQAGGRSFSWVKLKRADEKLLDDSVDCVVLGYYAGRGGRSEFGLGGFLAGVYDKKTDKFKTITKVGTGLTEDILVLLKKMCDKIKIAKLPANVDVDNIFMPDVVVKPSIVVELGADEISKSQTHSAGFALRFPRFIKFRSDKPAVESTSVAEIEQMFKKQKRGNY